MRRHQVFGPEDLNRIGNVFRACAALPETPSEKEKDQLAKAIVTLPASGLRGRSEGGSGASHGAKIFQLGLLRLTTRLGGPTCKRQHGKWAATMTLSASLLVQCNSAVRLHNPKCMLFANQCRKPSAGLTSFLKLQRTILGNI